MESKSGERQANDSSQEASPLWMCADAVNWNRADNLAASAAWLESNPESKAKFVAGLASVGSAAAALATFGLAPAIAAGLGGYALGQAVSGMMIHSARAQSIARLASFGHQWINEAHRRGMDQVAFKEVFRPRVIARAEHYAPQDWALAARGSAGQKALGLIWGLGKESSAFGALCLAVATSARWLSPSGRKQLKKAKETRLDLAQNPDLDWRLMPRLASQSQAKEIDSAIDSGQQTEAKPSVQRISKRL